MGGMDSMKTQAIQMPPIPRINYNIYPWYGAKRRQYLIACIPVK